VSPEEGSRLGTIRMSDMSTRNWIHDFLEKKNCRGGISRWRFLQCAFAFGCVRVSRAAHEQGCQMADFQTNIPNLGKFWRALKRKMLVCFMAIRCILWAFGIFVGHFDIFSRFGILYLETSGYPAREGRK
jgi:hypothetical protein